MVLYLKKIWTQIHHHLPVIRGTDEVLFLCEQAKSRMKKKKKKKIRDGIVPTMLA